MKEEVERERRWRERFEVGGEAEGRRMSRIRGGISELINEGKKLHVYNTKTIFFLFNIHNCNPSRSKVI